MKSEIPNPEPFRNRHLGPREADIKRMLKTIGVDSIDTLIDETIPESIRLEKELNLPKAIDENEFLRSFKKLAEKNKVFRSYIGVGYYDCYVPGVIQRNVLENPGWYTAYTPYQSEIAQGRLEALVNFQTMVMDLTGMEIANASLLDEATAAAEAMIMLFKGRKGAKKGHNQFFVDERVFPQTRDVMITRAEPLGIELVFGRYDETDFENSEIFGVLLQYPDSDGLIHDYSGIISHLKEQEIFVTVAADLMSLTMITPPGEHGVDVVVGTTQRFGVPLGYGGPHAAYFATKEVFKRNLPGRIIGISENAEGKPGYRMALQTREQHIRREKATSNICTAQVLLAVMAGMYGVYHGPEGLKTIAGRIHGHTALLEKGLKALGYEQMNVTYFDTLKVKVTDHHEMSYIHSVAIEKRINFRYYEEDFIGIALDETTHLEDLADILLLFAQARNQETLPIDLPKEAKEIKSPLPDTLRRTTDFMTHPVFNSYQSESEMMRYLKRLENKDISLVHSMIPLGSCTMKLNSAIEMIPVTWPEFSNVHPFAPMEQALGYQHMIKELEEWLCEITGFKGVSFQPNSGAQGEYTGLMVIRAYHQDRGEGHRNVTIIPSSAHGTNPASAVMAGMEVVIVKCDDKGNIDLDDLREKTEMHKDNLSALMVTYPSTHGVFEEDIIEICDIIHKNGGMVYMDGANMNAQVGLTSPARIGADVCHLNLHKTFSIPHGGGGPGMGPIAAVEELVPFFPTHAKGSTGGEKGITAISAAPWGSASILAISYAYIKMLGVKGMKEATKVAILNTNYIKARLNDHYPILYTGKNGWSAHEMIVDCREFKSADVEVEDIAKRLMDYGFHAPTVSFPVPGTLMVEPTESESLEELDRFCDAMISIREEIAEIENGEADAADNVLKNSPHTASMVTADEWDKPYSRSKAAYPLSFVRENKIWPASARIDNAYGDRNLMCSCLPIEAYEQQEEEAMA